MGREQQEIIARLRSAEGHLHAVVKMVEADKPCDQVLHQLEAVQAALRAAGCLLIEGQRQASMEVIQTSPNAGERTQALESLVGLYEKLSR